MGVSGGPKTNTTGLILSVDTANIKSFRGEPTTNLLPNLSSWVSYIATPTIVTVTDGPPYTLGKPKQVIQVITSGALHGGGNYGGIAANNINLLVSQSQSVAVSFWVRSLSGNDMQINFSHQNGGGDNSNLAFSTTNVGSDWRFLQQTASLSLTKNDMYIWNQTIRGGTFQITDFQLENKPYVTPHVSGLRGSGSIQGGGLVDLSYSENNGILINGPRFNSGSMGNIIFDGVDDYINCGNNSILDVGNNITVNAWINPSDIVNYQAIVAKVVSDFSLGWELANSNGGQLRATLRPSATQINLYSTTNLVLSAWQMVTMTFDNTTLKLYINGVPVGSTTTGGPVTLNSPASLWIGARVQGNYFSGSMANVIVYNRVLSENEVLQNFNSQRSRFGI